MFKINGVFKSWSPSRLADYEACPHFAALKHIVKLCPLCFDGSVKGGYDSPAVCNGCHEEILPGPALVRGSAVGKALEDYVNGTGSKLAGTWNKEGKPEPFKIEHPDILGLAKRLRAGHKKGKVKVEFMLNFDRNWNPLPVGRWSPDIWLIVKLDVLEMNGGVWNVIDWKTGGVEKKGPKAGQVKPSEKYVDQLLSYSTGVLLGYPAVEGTTAQLAFVDAGKDHEPFVERIEANLVRKDLPKIKKTWEKRTKAMFRDEIFAPRPSGDACMFCPFKKAKGGPCPH